jgi:arylsulfatase B
MQQAKQPNIVLIVADDLGWNDVSYHGGPIPTPNLDHIAQEGIDLNRFYVCPVCSPTRAGLMTGRYPHRFDMHGSPMQFWETKGMPPSEYNLAQALADAGYARRMAIGKWHLGNSTVHFHPLRQGFTDYCGHYCGAIDYYTHERGGQIDWHRNYESINVPGYSTNLMSEEAVRFIEGAPEDDPFFLYVAYNAVHTPIQAEPEDVNAMTDAFEGAGEYGRQDLVGVDDVAYREYYERKGRADTSVHVGPEKAGGRDQVFFGMTKCMDDGIGRILAALEKRGMTENTLVLFFSDNGGTCNNYPLRGQKGTTREGGVRATAAAKWPARFPGGRKCDAMLSYVDVLPTFAAAAGLQKAWPKQLDGTDMLGVLAGTAPEPDRSLYLGRHLMFDLPTVTNRKWKLCGDELHDMESDMEEANDVAADHPDIVKELRAEAERYEKLWGRACRPVGMEEQKPPANWDMPDLPIDDPDPA